jgi:hypothetical protein
MSKKRGAYRSRKLETKLRDNDRRRESAIYCEEEKKTWVSLKGKQRPPTEILRTRYVALDTIDAETQQELTRAVGGGSHRLDRYQAARIVVAIAIERGLITASEDDSAV